MTEENLRKSPCWYCRNKEFMTRFKGNGVSYWDYQCFYPEHWQHFGRKDVLTFCRDYGEVTEDVQTL